MSEQKLLRLFRAGRTYDEIAEANRRSMGWRPTRAGVAKKFARLRFPSRNMVHEELNPWRGRIKEEHKGHRLAKMLEAEGRRRRLMDADDRMQKGEELTDEDRQVIAKGLSETDKVLVSLLNDLLWGRGAQLVIGYNQTVGYYLTDATDEDETIIRRPSYGKREATGRQGAQEHAS